MTILYHTRPDGSFIAGCTETGITAEAMPWSIAAGVAKAFPSAIADQMISHEILGHVYAEIEASERAKDAGRMAEILGYHDSK